MPLLAALPALELELEQIMIDLSTMEDPEAARKLCAKRQAQAMFKFISAGLVQTTGTAAAQTGKIV